MASFKHFFAQCFDAKDGQNLEKCSYLRCMSSKRHPEKHNRKHEVISSFCPFSRQRVQSTESSLNCFGDVFKHLPRLLVVAHLFETLPLQIPGHEELKVEPVEQQAATQERVGGPLLHEHCEGRKKMLRLMFGESAAK